MSQELRSVTVKLPQIMYEQIRLMAEKRGENISDIIRFLLKRGLDERIYEENAQMIARTVREQMELVLDAYTVYPETTHYARSRKITGRIFDARVALCRPAKGSELVS